MAEQALITRAEAEALIERQMEMNVNTKPKESNAFHYGRCELRDLLDAIYGSLIRAALSPERD